MKYLGHFLPCVKLPIIFQRWLHGPAHMVVVSQHTPGNTSKNMSSSAQNSRYFHNSKLLSQQRAVPRYPAYLPTLYRTSRNMNFAKYLKIGKHKNSELKLTVDKYIAISTVYFN